MSSFINFNNKVSSTETMYSAEVIKIALLESETKNSNKVNKIVEAIKEPITLNEALDFFTDKLRAVKSLSNAIATINEGRVKQFEMDYASMVKDIKKGYGWIDPDYVAQTWDNSSDSIDFELVRDEIFDRLIAAGLLAHADDNNPEEAGKKIKSAKELYAFENVEVDEVVIDFDSLYENYEVIYSDGISAMKKFRSEAQALAFMKKTIASNKKLRDIAVYKPGMHSTTQTELVVSFWGNGSYLDNVSKRDPKLAAKKLEESVVTEGNQPHKEIEKAIKGMKGVSMDIKGDTIIVSNKAGDEFIYSMNDADDVADFITTIEESVVTEAKFVKDFNRDVLKATTKEEVLELYPNAEFFIGKSDHFFGELDGNLFFKAYYTKAQKEFEIKSVYSEKGSNYVHLYNESVVNEAKFDKKSLMKAMKKDDGIILVNGQEYIIYNPDNGNDDNTEMWGDKTIFALDQDGEEHEFKYSDIERFSESVVTEGKGFKNTKDFEDFLEEIDGMGESQIRKIMGKDYIDTPGFYQDEKDNYEDIIDFMISNMGDSEFKKLESWWENNVAESVVNEGRSISKIQKEWSDITTKMVQKVSEWKAAEGDRKAELLEELKGLTKQKQELEKELDTKVAGKDKDVQLAISEDHSDNPNDKYEVRPCDEEGTPWAVWEGDVRVECFATEEEAHAFADKQNQEQELEEGNAFGAARAEAIAKGKKEFKVDGETFKVEDVDAEDKENAEEFVEESKITLDSLVEMFTEKETVTEDLRSDVKKFIKQNNKELDELADQDQWDLMYQKLYDEFEVEADSTKGKDLLKTFQFIY